MTPAIRISEPVQVDIPVINDNNNNNNNNFVFGLNPNINIEENDDNDNTNNVIEDTKETPDPAIALENQKRLEAVRKGMEHAWGGYVKYTWREDEVHSVSKSRVQLARDGRFQHRLSRRSMDHGSQRRAQPSPRLGPRQLRPTAIGTEVSFFETTIA